LLLKVVGQKGDKDLSECNDSETFNLLTRKFDKFLNKNNQDKNQPSKRYNSGKSINLILQTILVLDVGNRVSSRLIV